MAGGGYKNVTPNNTFAKMSKEECSKWGKIGAAKTAETKRRKKELRETLEVLLDLSVKNGKSTDVENVKSFAAIKGKNITVNQALMVTLVNKGLHGDLQAIAMIRDTLGQKPTEKVEATVKKNPFDELTADELRELIKNDNSE